MIYNLIMANDKTYFAYCVASEITKAEDVLFYFRATNTSRQRRSYIEPSYPIYEVGSMFKSTNDDWVAKSNIHSDDFIGTFDECKTYLFQCPLGSELELGKLKLV